VAQLSQVAGALMSPWNLLTFTERREGNPLPFPSNTTPIEQAVDLAVRAMCHHQLGQHKEAEKCLRMSRYRLGKEGGSLDDERALLREAELLIEGKTKP
jgi:hypothetical protein